MAQKIDDERLAQSVVYSFMGEQAPNVEEIARMMAIKRRNNLAGVKVCETYDRHFGKTEFFLHAGRYRPDRRRIHTPSQHRRDLDLDLHVIGTSDQLGYVFLSLRRTLTYKCPGNAALDFLSDPADRRIDFLEGGLAICDGNIGEINIDRKPRHVAHEQVDRRSALEREGG